MPPRKPAAPAAPLVHIQTVVADNSPRSKAQQEFNRLSKRIAKLEVEVATFREAATALRQRVQHEYRPLQAEHNRLRAELVRLLDQAFEQQKLTKTERGKITFLISEACYDLPQKGHPELQPLIDKYAPPPTKEEAQAADREAAERMKDYFSEEFGVEFDDDADVSSPEKVQAYLRQKLAEQQAAFEAEEQARAERRASRKKSPKQQAAEEKKQAEQTSITKAVRTLYLDLVKHLHPDREPDEAERTRKTELLKRVTTAYEAGELLTLLRLQLELDRIDQAHLENLADDQLRYYNKLLKEQAQELDALLFDEQQQLASFAGMPAYLVRTSAAMGQDFGRQKTQLQAKITQLAADLASYAQDPAALKAFLKEFKVPKLPPGPLIIRLPGASSGRTPGGAPAPRPCPGPAQPPSAPARLPARRRAAGRGAAAAAPPEALVHVGAARDGHGRAHGGGGQQVGKVGVAGASPGAWKWRSRCPVHVAEAVGRAYQRVGRVLEDGAVANAHLRYIANTCCQAAVISGLVSVK
ncbi:hypothetical protein MRB53_041954 [Persea americana]|nr:hypothetical protein MRB53_041954 [Persea americana]